MIQIPKGFTLVPGTETYVGVVAGQLVASIEGGPIVPVNAANDSLYTTLNAATGPRTSLTLNGLNGDVDGDYLITGRANSAVGTNVLSLLLNGSPINLWWLASNDLVGGAVATVGWTWVQNGAAGGIVWSANDYIEFTFWLRARSGRTRAVELGTGVSLKAGALTTFSCKGEFLNAGSNIVSISQLSNQNNGLGVGSYLRAIPMGTSNPLSLAPAAPQIAYVNWQDNTLP